MNIVSRWRHWILTPPSPAKPIVIISLLLQIIIGGLRFSDGGVLLAIANGGGIHHPSFSNPFAQYNWESPLKVFLLRHLPFHGIIPIALLFAVLAAPLVLGIFAPSRSSFYKYTAALILFTPAAKISFQNIGLGDGLVLFLSLLCVCFLSSPIALYILLLAIGSWHPGQVIFISASVFLAACLTREVRGPSRSGSGRLTPIFFACALAVVSSRVLLALHNLALGFKYVDRWQFMMTEMNSFWRQNLQLSPIVAIVPIFYILLFLGLASRSPRVSTLFKYSVLAWFLLCFSIGLLTTDPARVMNLCLLPLLISISSLSLERSSLEYSEDDSNRLAASKHSRLRSACLFLPLLIILLPLPGWSGINFSVWGDLLSDACKYGLTCAAK